MILLLVAMVREDIITYKKMFSHIENPEYDPTIDMCDTD